MSAETQHSITIAMVDATSVPLQESNLRTAVAPLLLLLLLAACASSTGGRTLVNDPNCQVNVVQGALIPNYGGPPTNARQSDSTNTIALLVFADLYRLPPFRLQTQLRVVRLDVQGAVNDGGRNWQVQINGVNGNSLAAMLLGAGLANATGSNQANVQRSARSALVKSLNDHHIYSVAGTCN